MVFAAGCGGPGTPSAPRSRGPETLLIAAAADLANVQKPLLQAFGAVSGASADMVLGSSGILARQIEQGAPYDVFLSANQDYIEQLAAAGKLDRATVRVYAAGRVGLWSQGGRIRNLEELTDSRVLHIAIPNPAHAPYGAAARQALEKAGIWSQVESKLVFSENARQALQYGESGNAEAVLTAWSLVFDRGAVLVPDNLHSPVIQSGGVVRGSSRPAAAGRFMEFLVGQNGQRILKAGGFGPPPAP